MKKLIILIILSTLFLPDLGLTQGSFEAILNSIELNNKSLKSVRQEGEEFKLRNHTGLTLENPQINYDYMIGSPVTAGNQTDVVLSQSFDFPGVYIKRKNVALERDKLAELIYQRERLSILFEARQLCVEQIYLNKLNSQYIHRKQSLEQLISAYKKKLESGGGTILEVNKAQLQLIEVKRDFELNQSQIRQNNEKLSALNGGVPIVFVDTIYPVFNVSPSFDSYMSEVLEKDPFIRLIEQENVIATREIELSRMMTLPKFELGYHYQGILGQRFNGAHAAITIPLWENKNVVNVAEANLTTKELEKQEYETVRYHDLKGTYEKYVTLKETLEEYEDIFTTFSNTGILLKALNYGEITSIEYFMELSYYYTNFNHYLETERDMYQTLNELMKYY